MNIVVVNTFRRPFHTRLCLEAIARAQRWSGGWADEIWVCFPCNYKEHPQVHEEFCDAQERNRDIPFRENLAVGVDVPSTPHDMSKWMLDGALIGRGADMAVYVEDDAVLAVDAFLMCEYVKRMTDQEQPAYGFYGLYGPYGPAGMTGDVLGCCLYHETIPEQYIAEGRPEGPDARLLHLGNGLNTCGGTAFLREPYLKYLSPNWNCKQVEPRGFDYSAHYLMYLHGLYMVWPDLSRSNNIGFDAGSISQPQWAKYFGRSIWAQTKDAARDWREFRMDGLVPPLVKEEWMGAELAHRGLL
jgi:hypothetical protein